MLLYIDRVAISTARSPVSPKLQSHRHAIRMGTVSLRPRVRALPDAGRAAGRSVWRASRARTHRRVVVGVHRADGPRVGLRVAAAFQVPVRRGRSRRVSDLRESVLCVAAGRRARAGAGHQFFRLASRRGLCASRSGVADRDGRMARRIHDPWRARAGVGGCVVRVVPQHAGGASRRVGGRTAAHRQRPSRAGCGRSSRAAARTYVVALCRTCGSRWRSTSRRISRSSSA